MHKSIQRNDGPTSFLIKEGVRKIVVKHISYIFNKKITRHFVILINVLYNLLVIMRSHKVTKNIK